MPFQAALERCLPQWGAAPGWQASACLIGLRYGGHDSGRVKKSNTRMLPMLRAQPAAVSCAMEPGRDLFQTHTALRLPTDGWYRRLAGMAGLSAPN